jgi:hypothetical protein
MTTFTTVASSIQLEKNTTTKRIPTANPTAKRLPAKRPTVPRLASKTVADACVADRRLRDLDEWERKASR